MDDFRYINGTLHAESIAMDELATRFGTPCYVYSSSTLLSHYDKFAAAFAAIDPLICFAIKSCSNIAICRLLAERGAGMDIVSGGELHRALLAGADPGRCVFAGVGKTDDEIHDALAAGVGWINIESDQEFEVVRDIAHRMNVTCNAALRVNPDVDPHTHEYTTTGTRQTKFGIDIGEARAFFDRHGQDTGRHCPLRGIHLHIGSPVYGPRSYEHAIERALELIDGLRAAGHDIEMLDVGGGFGADYETGRSPDAAAYASSIVPLLQAEADRGTRIVIEPGRAIVANAGVMLLRVLYIKQNGGKTFVICDGGMNLMIRPALYDAFHFIWPAQVAAEHEPGVRREHMSMPGLQTVDVVGPICESGDFLARGRAIPPVRRDDLLAVFAAGAYGMAMASHYNSHPLPAEVLVDGDEAHLIRRRETYDDLTAAEAFAPAAIRAGAAAS